MRPALYGHTPLILLCFDNHAWRSRALDNGPLPTDTRPVFFQGLPLLMTAIHLQEQPPVPSPYLSGIGVS